MEYVLVIDYKFPSYNEYQDLQRKNKYAGAKKKREIQDDIGLFINKLPEIKKPVTVTFTWIEGNLKRDLDNIAFAKKFVLDALVECGKIKNDNPVWVRGFEDRFKYLKDVWRLCIRIKEIEEVEEEEEDAY